MQNQDELLLLFAYFKYNKNQILSQFFEDPDDHLTKAGIIPSMELEVP